ncbi:amidohydrolase [Psychrobium sp. 1_MG-2023]|uniref:amidohydrolase family protein n=1 Tax=Psychrobium sp. 1_MG-2023 TaxID=3062624 RepID=UPI000C338F0C|nr:amidohydrolase family protein [Psychrobium sp. 1_MG-2023]MDP2561766.1 amidohydrolase family protein [Psychrobium sp. 1_MG-2023]PKF59749.1 amidohydrolase [Alteromonadales bacterium alter-6D02]
MDIIDPHIHLFDLTQGHYDWLKPSHPPFWSDKALINRSFDCSELTLKDDFNLTGFVHIEAGFDNEQPWREIEWLAQNATLPFKGIAAIDITQPPHLFKQAIDKLMSYSSVVGGRHILDEQAYELLSMQSVRENLTYLAQYQFIFETQLNGTDSAGVEALVNHLAELDDLVVVLNHAGFCPEEDKRVWQQSMVALAQYSNVFIKASGWEMVNRHYDTDYVSQVVLALITLFGEQRVMLASNFPLCLFSKQYNQLWHQYLSLGLTEQQQQWLLHDNAARVYQLQCN